MNILDVEQYSTEWWLARKGKFTASDAHTIAVAGVGLKTLCWAKASELIMSDEQYLEVISRRKSTAHMEFGAAQEGFGLIFLSGQLGVDIDRGGFASFDDNTGFSADGIINNSIGVEIKNSEPKIAFPLFTNIMQGLKEKLPMSELLDKEHYAQIQFSLLKSKWKNWLFCLGSDYWGDELKYWILENDSEVQEKIEAGLEKGKIILTENVNRLLESMQMYQERKDIDLEIRKLSCQ